MLEKLRENSRMVVAVLISAGVIALAIGNSGNNNNEVTTEVTGDTETSQTVEAVDEVVEEENATDDLAIGSEPVAGPVEISKGETKYSATVRSGDNQSVVVRQMVNDYLGDQSESLSAEQRLYVETVVVDSLPRNDIVFVGDVVEVEESAIANAVAASGELTDAQVASWSVYL